MSHTVLICDDAIFMRTMVGDILQQAGFEIVGEAETGVQAVEKYKQLRPDLVTMDIVMPDMGGIDAVREICKFDPGAKVLMCSAMGQQALVVEAIQAGAKDFVVQAVSAEPRARSRAARAGVKTRQARGVRRARAGPERAPLALMDSAQYAELFLTESREHVSAINHSLLELERGAGEASPWTRSSAPCTRSRE